MTEERRERMEQFSIERRKGAKRRRNPPIPDDVVEDSSASEQTKNARRPCPRPGCAGDFRVIQTYGPRKSGASDGRVILRRKRRCTACGYQYLTDESYDEKKS